MSQYQEGLEKFLGRILKKNFEAIIKEIKKSISEKSWTVCKSAWRSRAKHFSLFEFRQGLRQGDELSYLLVNWIDQVNQDLESVGRSWEWRAAAMKYRWRGIIKSINVQ